MGLQSSLYGSGPDEEEIFGLVKRTDPSIAADAIGSDERARIESADYQDFQDAEDERRPTDEIAALLEELTDEERAAIELLLREWLDNRAEDEDK